MSYLDSMVFIDRPEGYSIGLINDTLYNPDSADNVIAYNKFYAERLYEHYNFPIRHGIFLFKDGEIERSACVCSSGGQTGIHSRSSVLDRNSFLICCADSIFCLALPDLNLNWITKADHATCFGIYKYQDGYIVHGELEITRLDNSGRIIWQFSGSNIFTTPTGRSDFKLNGNVIEAVNWESVKFTIDRFFKRIVKPFGNIDPDGR
jgi:hypothetical protein